MDAKHDEEFAKIFKSFGHAVPFLNAVFGFLCRRTDFFHPEVGPLPSEGGVERVVLSLFREWANRSSTSEVMLSGNDIPVVEECEIGAEILPPEKRNILKAVSKKKHPLVKEALTMCVDTLSTPADGDSEMADISMTPNICSHSNEVDNCESNASDIEDSALSSKNQDHKTIQDETTGASSSRAITLSPSDCYNGAVRDGYRWSQTITDLDVQVTVSPCVQKGNTDVRVKLTSGSLRVEARDSEHQWVTLVEGELSRPINKEESIWTLIPGQYVQIHFEKAKDCWWDALMKSEPKIDLRHIDATRAMEDLSEEEHMKIEELMWNEERKRQGLLTSNDLGLCNILKEAWDKEGSPFKGRPYDPSLLNFANGSCTIQPKNK